MERAWGWYGSQHTHRPAVYKTAEADGYSHNASNQDLSVECRDYLMVHILYEKSVAGV